jgi:amino acid permease
LRCVCLAIKFVDVRVIVQLLYGLTTVVRQLKRVYKMQESNDLKWNPSPVTAPTADRSLRHDISGRPTGTDIDAHDMARLGRKQELRRNFKSVSILGLATTTMSTWVALMLTSLFSLINGGRAGTIWVYLASWLCTFALAASLAELASMAPTSGGQYRTSKSVAG